MPTKRVDPGRQPAQEMHVDARMLEKVSRADVRLAGA